MTVKTNARLVMQAISDFDDAAQEYAFIGSKPPSDHEYYEALYQAAKLRLQLLTGCIKPTKGRVKHLYELDAVVNEGPHGPTDEERGG